MPEIVKSIQLCTLFDASNYPDCPRVNDVELLDKTHIFECELDQNQKCGFKRRAILKIEVED